MNIGLKVGQPIPFESKLAGILPILALLTYLALTARGRNAELILPLRVQERRTILLTTSLGDRRLAAKFVELKC